MSLPRILVLGGRSPGRGPAAALGWHLNELQAAATRQDVDLFFADYESLTAEMDLEADIESFAAATQERGHPSSFAIQNVCSTALCESIHIDRPVTMRLDAFDAILTRTMPAGSMEAILFRLAIMHDEYYRREKAGRAATFINPPAALELAIDKYATLARAARLGIPTPATVVTQSRGEAMQAFERLGRDVVVKPIFGGEGRGVMRIRDEELAWTTFSTLQQLGCVFYVQRFCAPGGNDVRLLVIGPHVHAVRRTNTSDFRTNVRAGGHPTEIPLSDQWRDLAARVCEQFGLTFAAVDLIQTDDDDGDRLMEVNAIPGWKSTQTAVRDNIAEQLISVLKSKTA